MVNKIKQLQENGRLENFKRFVDRNIGDHVSTFDSTWIWKDTFKCPCCEYLAINACGKDDYEGVLRGFMLHINSKIRLHGDTNHIRLFEELFGPELVLPVLQFHKQRCLIAAINIEREIVRINKKFAFLGADE